MCPPYQRQRVRVSSGCPRRTHLPPIELSPASGHEEPSPPGSISAINLNGRRTRRQQLHPMFDTAHFDGEVIKPVAARGEVDLDDPRLGRRLETRVVEPRGEFRSEPPSIVTTALGRENARVRTNFARLGGREHYRLPKPLLQ